MKYFYKDIELNVPDGVYYPREDSELLAKALECMALEGKRALEMGCGSGLLSILMAKKGAHVTAVDINPDAVETTEINAEKNGAALSALFSDMFENVHGHFDLIVFNSPYLPIEEKEIPDVTYGGGLSGREAIEKFLTDVKIHMEPECRFLLVISSLTGEKEVLSMIKEAGLRPVIVLRQKVPWEELAVIEAQY